MKSNRDYRVNFELINRHSRILFIITLANLVVITVDAKHLNREQVNAIENDCKSAERPIFAQLRKEAIAECKVKYKKNRGDPATCNSKFKDLQPGGTMTIRPQLSACKDAFDARKHFHQSQ